MGDAFCAAFAVATASNEDLPTCLRWGTAAGALSCQTAGAQPSLPGHQALMKMLGDGV